MESVPKKTSDAGSQPSEPQFVEISDTERNRFSSLLSDSKKSLLERRLNEICSDFGTLSLADINKDLSQTLDEFTVIKEEAASMGLRLCEQLSSAIVDKIDPVTGELEQIDENLFYDALNRMLRGVDVLWEVRTFIDKSGSERVFWSNPISRDNFDNVLSGLNQPLK